MFPSPRLPKLENWHRETQQYSTAEEISTTEKPKANSHKLGYAMFSRTAVSVYTRVGTTTQSSLRVWALSLRRTQNTWCAAAVVFKHKRTSPKIQGLLYARKTLMRGRTKSQRVWVNCLTISKPELKWCFTTLKAGMAQTLGLPTSFWPLIRMASKLWTYTLPAIFLAPTFWYRVIHGLLAMFWPPVYQWVSSGLLLTSSAPTSLARNQ